MSLLSQLGVVTQLKFPIGETVDCSFTVQGVSASTGTPQFEFLFTYNNGEKEATFPFWIGVTSKTSGICSRYLGTLVGLQEDEKVDEQGWLTIHKHLESTHLNGYATIKVVYDADSKSNNITYFELFEKKVEEVANEMNTEANTEGEIDF